jgi:hypothetical protein
MRLEDIADPMIPSPIIPTGFASMFPPSICGSIATAKSKTSRSGLYSKKDGLKFPWPDGHSEDVEFSAKIFYKFVRVILILLARIEAHDTHE